VVFPFSLPNFLTVSRVLLTIFSLFSYHSIGKMTFFLMLTLALLTDLLDGYVARCMNLSTSLGAVLDPACDKILIALMISFFYIEGVLSKNFHVLLLVRSFVQMFSFLYVMRWSARFSIQPNLLAKSLNTAIFLMIFVFSFCLAFDFRDFLCNSKWVTLFLSLLSFFEIYFMIYYPAQFYKILKKEKLGFD
jgi:cardiolipin synthase